MGTTAASKAPDRSTPTITFTDIRTLVATQRKLLAAMSAALDEVERKLDGHESTGQEMKRVNEAFTRAWSRRYNAAYVYQGAKDATAVKRLLQTLTPDQIIERISRYFATDDPFVLKTRHALAVFASNINQYIPEALPLDGADFACSHTPRCTSAAAHTSKKLAEAR